MSTPISGFTAIPNPQMLAFMPIQSYLMMYFAGAGWQIGKRKISAIPNDQFNKMSANDLLKGFTADLRETIPTLERSLNDITPLIRVLIEQYGDFVREAIRALPQTITNIAGVSAEQAEINLQSNLSAGGIVPGASGSQAQFLAYAKILLQQEANRIAQGKLDTKIGTATTTSRPFQGPEINPATGEQSTFLKDIRKLPPPDSHIKDRSRSNVSLQSLTIERSRLNATVRSAGITYKNALAQINITKTWSSATKRRQSHRIIAWGQAVGIASGALNTARQALANFLRMHGSRF